MQNKRGIPQTFGPAAAGIKLRRATVFDVFDMSQILTRSIHDLCSADHGDDPKLVSLWTANKDPETIRKWIISGAELWLAEVSGRPAAVGGLAQGHAISLLYVDPDHLRQGLGAALLARLEQELARAGCAKAHLDATKTAQGFYAAQGWQPAGPAAQWNGIPQFPMRKSLHPAR